MTQVENYKDILEKIFGRQITFTNNSIENNCIGALRDSNNFDVFRTNFIDRLKRINDFYINEPSSLIEIINTAKQIGNVKGYKWSGPYSELVALDFWIQFKDIMNIKFIDKAEVNSFEDSIAKKIGQQVIDLDISFDLHTKRIFTDVKSLIPTHTELIDKILQKLKSRTVNQDYLIGIDDVFEVDYLRTKKDFIYELQNGTLIDALENCVNNRQTHYRHKLVSEQYASFRISYAKQGLNTVLSTVRIMDSYKLALDYKYKVLDYYNKLLINKPSLITFVVNPWFNQELNTSHDFFTVFYRSLSRRVFMELTKDTTDMEFIYPELKGKNLKICDIASLISGIIFINDNSILLKGNKINDAYIYLNPNAKNKVLTSHDFNILKWSHDVNQPFIDDFYYDNY